MNSAWLPVSQVKVKIDAQQFCVVLVQRHGMARVVTLQQERQRAVSSWANGRP